MSNKIYFLKSINSNVSGYSVTTDTVGEITAEIVTKFEHRGLCISLCTGGQTCGIYNLPGVESEASAFFF